METFKYTVMGIVDNNKTSKSRQRAINRNDESLNGVLRLSKSGWLIVGSHFRFTSDWHVVFNKLTRFGWKGSIRAAFIWCRGSQPEPLLQLWVIYLLKWESRRTQDAKFMQTRDEAWSTWPIKAISFRNLSPTMVWSGQLLLLHKHLTQFMVPFCSIEKKMHECNCPQFSDSHQSTSSGRR